MQAENMTRNCCCCCCCRWTWPWSCQMYLALCIVVLKSLDLKICESISKTSNRSSSNKNHLSKMDSTLWSRDLNRTFVIEVGSPFLRSLFKKVTIFCGSLGCQKIGCSLKLNYHDQGKVVQICGTHCRIWWFSIQLKRSRHLLTFLKDDCVSK